MRARRVRPSWPARSSTSTAQPVCTASSPATRGPTTARHIPPVSFAVPPAGVLPEGELPGAAAGTLGYVPQPANPLRATTSSTILTRVESRMTPPYQELGDGGNTAPTTGLRGRRVSPVPQLLVGWS